MSNNQSQKPADKPKQQPSQAEQIAELTERLAALEEIVVRMDPPRAVPPPFKTVMRGDDIQWFPQADLDRPPQLAKLLGMVDADTGMADVLIFSDEGSTNRVLNVPHVSAQGLWDSTRMLRTALAKNKGAWDFSPRLRPANAPENSIPSRAAMVRHDPFDSEQNVQAVLDAASKPNARLEAVVKLATPLGFTASDVRALCRKHSLLDEQLI